MKNKRGLLGLILIMASVLMISMEVSAQTLKLVQPGTWRNWKIYTTAKDTLNKSAFGDTISTITSIQKYQTVNVTLGDISNSSTDSSVVEVMLPDSQWVQVGAKNLLTGSVVQALVPGDGKTVIYEIVPQYMTDYRIRRTNTYKARIKSYVTFQAVSP
jgi:predicted DNA binding protein